MIRSPVCCELSISHSSCETRQLRVPISTCIDLYRRAEAVLDACIARAERGEAWVLREGELADVERVLVAHDEQLVAIPKHRYLEAWDRLQRFVKGTTHSPIRNVGIG